MGLDNFKSDESPSKQSNSDEGDNQNKESSKTSSSKKKNKPFKTVGVGQNRKVFRNEEMWDETVSYIENVMGFEIDKVLKWPDKYRHKALHVAILNSSLGEDREFDVTKTCFVCGHEFEFPEDWDYETYRDSVSCSTHELGEVVKRYNINKGEYDGS